MIISDDKEAAHIRDNGFKLFIARLMSLRETWCILITPIPILLHPCASQLPDPCASLSPSLIVGAPVIKYYLESSIAVLH